MPETTSLRSCLMCGARSARVEESRPTRACATARSAVAQALVRQAEDRLRRRIPGDAMVACWRFGRPLPMPNGSVGCVIERHKPASTFGLGVYPLEIQVMSVPSEKVSLSFRFLWSWIPDLFHKPRQHAYCPSRWWRQELSSKRHPACQGSCPEPLGRNK